MGVPIPIRTVIDVGGVIGVMRALCDTRDARVIRPAGVPGVAMLFVTGLVTGKSSVRFLRVSRTASKHDAIDMTFMAGARERRSGRLAHIQHRALAECRPEVDQDRRRHQRNRERVQRDTLYARWIRPGCGNRAHGAAFCHAVTAEGPPLSLGGAALR